MGSIKWYASKKLDLARSSRPDVFCKKGVLRNVAKYTGKHLCRSLFFNKVAGLRHLWRTPLVVLSAWQCFFCEAFTKLCEISACGKHRDFWRNDKWRTVSMLVCERQFRLQLVSWGYFLKIRTQIINQSKPPSIFLSFNASNLSTFQCLLEFHSFYQQPSHRVWFVKFL